MSNIGSFKARTLELYNGLRSSGKITAFCVIFTKKFLFLTLLISFAAVSAAPVLTDVSTTDYLLYYSLPQTLGEYRPETLFGIMNFTFGDFNAMSMMLKGAYLVLLVVFTSLVFFLLKRINSGLRKFEAFTAIIFIFGIAVASGEQYFPSNFGFNAMIAMVLIMGCVTAIGSMKTRYIPVAVLLIAASQLVEYRTIMFTVPAALVTFLLAKHICKEPRKLRAYCLSVILTAAAVLTVTQVMSMNNTNDMVNVYSYITENEAPEQGLENTDITYWYTATVFDWISYYVPSVFTDYGAFRIFIDKNNFVLLTIAFVLSYAVKRSRTVSGGLAPALKAIFRMDGEGSYTKMFTVLCLTFVAYVDILVPPIGYILFLMTSAAVFAIYRLEKDRLSFNDKIDTRFFFGISIILISAKYLVYIFKSSATDYDFLVSYASYQSFGLIPRGIFSSALHLVFGYYISTPTVETIMLLIKILFLFLFLLYIHRCVRSTPSGLERKVVGMLAFALVVSPALSFFFYKKCIYKTLDVLFVVVGLVCIELSARNKHLVWFIPFISALGVFIHQVYVSMVFPAVFIILVYRAFVDNGGYSVRNIINVISTVAITGASFFYFMIIYRSPEWLTIDNFFDILQERSGSVIFKGDDFFHAHTNIIAKTLYFTDSSEHFGFWRDQIKPEQVQNALFMLVVMLPVLAGFIYMLKHSSSMENKLLPKLAYLAAGLSLIVIVPPFITEIDYGRWCGFAYLTVMIAFLKLTMIQTKEKKWYKDISPDLLNKYLIIVVAVSAMFPTLTDDLFAMYMLHM